MTDSETGDDQQRSDAVDDSVDRSDDGDSGSRFDAFHERLDDRESARDRALKEDDSEESDDADGTTLRADDVSEPERNGDDEPEATIPPNAGNEGADTPGTLGESDGADDQPVTDEQKANAETNAQNHQPETDEQNDQPETDKQYPQQGGEDSEAYPDDWQWGSPKPGSDSDQSDPDDGDDGGDRPTRPSAATRTDGRIWDADPIDRPSHGNRPEPPQQAARGEPKSRPDRPTDGDEAQSERSEAAESDRWAELETILETDDTSTTKRPTDGSTSEAVSGDNEEAAIERRSTGPLSGRSRHHDGASPGVDLSDEIERATSASSVLVLGPSNHPVADTICSRFLTHEGESRDVIFVTFEDSPADRIDLCRNSDDWAGGNIGVIVVGHGGRGERATSEITSDVDGGSITVRHVTNPADLSKLGIVITRLLSSFDETPRETILCVHTLSALHREVGTKTMFRFLTTLQGRLNAANAVGHYQMNPELHDEMVIETLRPIFERVVRFSADGTFEIE